MLVVAGTHREGCDWLNYTFRTQPCGRIRSTYLWVACLRAPFLWRRLLWKHLPALWSASCWLFLEFWSEPAHPSYVGGENGWHSGLVAGSDLIQIWPHSVGQNPGSSPSLDHLDQADFGWFYGQVPNPVP